MLSLWNITKLNSDLLIMEEEMATENRISQIHENNKQAIVWTVNKEDFMYKFLNSKVDAIITDEIELVERIQTFLDNRTDLRVIQDNISEK